MNLKDKARELLAVVSPRQAVPKSGGSLVQGALAARGWRGGGGGAPLSGPGAETSGTAASCDQCDESGAGSVDTKDARAAREELGVGGGAAAGGSAEAGWMHGSSQRTG